AFARQMRLHPIPLVIFQHQTNSAHPSLRAQKELESDLRVRRKPECQRALGEMDQHGLSKSLEKPILLMIY
ncbi:hypothetical protein, partial [Microvirga tunisiensis]|uniref:hypothetical protein n=1 Tax=Microvirga tunisiensis TaxID=2108360 RepID=UPI001AEE942E